MHLTIICSKLGIDVIKMCKTLRGNCYIVTCIDYFSKWPEAMALQDKSAVSIAKFIFETICRYVHYINKIY